ncbi:MAG: ribulose-phosphate 3-epimerase [Candidatus Peribacteraceae bacterium]|nr:ribulose-phosphate 3-epimerase [Candidatus Peribacteraceae bacterium]
MVVPAHSVLITPSILSCNLARLQEEVDSIEKYADWLQVDVMDGHFVPNLSMGAPVVKHLKTKLPLDIHLMVSNPHERLKEFFAVGAKHITFHAEAVASTGERKDIISDIRKGGAGAGIALNPGTPISVIDDVVHEVDLVLVMSVHPGFSGQKFMSEVLGKVTALRKAHPELMIQMDGGIDSITAKECRKAGANNLVSASYIFSAQDRKAAIAALRSA